MRGDFSRDSFAVANHFSRVLSQQGRVLLDADWNEQVAILLNGLRSFTTDLVGPHAGPILNLGFEVIGDVKARFGDPPRAPDPADQATIDRLNHPFKRNFLIGK